MVNNWIINLIIGVGAGFGGAILLTIMSIIIIKSKKRRDNKRTKKEKEKKIKLARKNLIRRIEKMSLDQFDAYYDTLITIYGREMFYSSLAKKYVSNLRGENSND